MLNWKSFVSESLIAKLGSQKKNSYYNSPYIIITGEKTNLIRDMKNNYRFEEGLNNKIYFFDNFYHFATLYKTGRLWELRHDGSLTDQGRRDNKKRINKNL